MSTKPTTAAEYRLRPLDVVRSTCLHVATKLDDLLRDVVVVGGLVPSLLIDQEGLESGDERHVGTVDLDVGLSLAILNGRRYEEVSARLRRAGFAPDRNDKGQPTSQGWRIDEPPGVTVDFLIGPSAAEDQGGDLRNIENDFAAIIAPGLPLAFRDAERVSMSGHTLLGEPATREVQVCGPGAYVVLKLQRRPMCDPPGGEIVIRRAGQVGGDVRRDRDPVGGGRGVAREGQQSSRPG